MPEKCRVIRKAPKGKFRVIVTETLRGVVRCAGDYELVEAEKIAEEQAGEITAVSIYNDRGRHIKGEVFKTKKS